MPKEEKKSTEIQVALNKAQAEGQKYSQRKIEIEKVIGDLRAKLDGLHKKRQEPLAQGKDTTAIDKEIAEIKVALEKEQDRIAGAETLVVNANRDVVALTAEKADAEKRERREWLEDIGRRYNAKAREFADFIRGLAVETEKVSDLDFRKTLKLHPKIQERGFWNLIGHIPKLYFGHDLPQNESKDCWIFSIEDHLGQRQAAKRGKA